MSDPRRGQMPVSELDQTGQEFLDAQAVKHPISIEELKQASESSAHAVEAVLGDTSTFDEWIELSVDLDELFLEEADGALGKKLIELSTLDDQAFSARQQEAETIVRQSADAASRLYPLIHRLQTLGFAPNRAEVVHKLCVGDLVTTQKVHNVSIVPVRTTVIGMLAALDKRVGSNFWSLEIPPAIPTSVIVTDPFDKHATADYWRRAILARRETFPDREHSILTISGDKTGAVAWELENIIERSDDNDLKDAATVLVEFLNRKAVYYQNPDPRDFEMYHLGMEQPDELMNIFRALDTIKHKDPELFLELLGINPDDGGRSVYFGSLLHKAIYNTQQAVDRAGPELGELAIRTMLKQLMTMKEHVKTYAGVVSQESLKALAREMKKGLEGMKGEERGKMLTMMSVPFLPLAIDAEVRRQLESLREANIETISADLKRHINDIEHPLKLLEFITTIPAIAFNQPEVKKQLEALYPDKHFSGPDLQKLCRERDYEILFPLYDRIPLLDETKTDLGLDHLLKTVFEDALSLEGRLARAGFFESRTIDSPIAEVLSKTTEMYESKHPGFRLFVEYVRHRGFPKLLVIQFQTTRNVLEKRFLETVLAKIPILPDKRRIIEIRPDDRAYLLGQMIVELIKKHGSTKELVNEKASEMIRLSKHEDKEWTDVVFLSMLSHAGDEQIAFKLFNAFAELIPAERLYELLHLEADQMKKFEKLFWEEPQPLVWAYVEYIKSAMRHVDVAPDRLQWNEAGRKIELYSRLNTALLHAKSPVSFFLTYPVVSSKKREVDLFDLFNELNYEMSKKRLISFSGKTEEVINKTLYDLPQEERMFVRDQLLRYLDKEIMIEELVETLISVMTKKIPPPHKTFTLDTKKILLEILEKKLKTRP